MPKITFWGMISLLCLWSAACAPAPAPTSTPLPPSQTPVPTSTSTPEPTATLTFTPQPTLPPQTPSPGVTRIPLEPLIRTDLSAPLTIDLPETWTVLFEDALPMQEGAGIGMLPFSVYTGPVQGGTGFISVIWAFPNITSCVPEIIPGMVGSEPVVNLRSDGLRLLYLAMVEPGCRLGTDDRTFMVGDREAEGGYFAAEDCPELPDVRGWFAALQVENINFAFYVYAEPIQAMDDPAVRAALQAIMDTIRFDMSLLPEPRTPDPAAAEPTP